MPYAMWCAMACLAVLLSMPSMASAQSPTETCVVVQTSRPDAEAIRALVMTEIDRFPTHRSAAEGCGSHLRVEIIDLAGKSYVTGRINTQVPHREPVEGDDLATAIERMLRVVLHNDPVRLRGPRSENFLRRGLSGLKNGETLLLAEVYQVVTPLDGGVSSLAGVAVGARREAADWHLAARIHYAGRLASPPAGALAMTGRVGVAMQLAWFDDALADTAWYVAAEAGVDHQRFEGPAPRFGGEDESYTQTGFALGVRGGVELFRATTTRLDLFVQATLPVFMTTDDEGGVVDGYLPGFTAGAAMLF